MRLREPRIQPIRVEAATSEQRDLLEALPQPLRGFNIFTTMAQAPEAMRRFNTWGAYIAGAGTRLIHRDRELAILRTVWLCRSDYEWGHHAANASKCGLSGEDLGRIKIGADELGWPPRDAAILRMADEIVRDQFVSNETWASLESFTEDERMDLVFTIGQYVLASTIVNTFGVQLEDKYVRNEDFYR